MLPKKLLVGAAILTVAISTGAIAYAAAPPNDGSQNGLQYRQTISINGEDGIPLDGIDKNNLPEGVFYQDEVSMEITGGMSLK